MVHDGLARGAHAVAPITLNKVKRTGMTQLVQMQSRTRLPREFESCHHSMRLTDGRTGAGMKPPIPLVRAAECLLEEWADDRIGFRMHRDQSVYIRETLENLPELAIFNARITAAVLLPKREHDSTSPSRHH